jgi:predicted anti-sigma-YlaC factor YlaD
MDSQTATTEEICPRSAIAAYIDGELAPPEEMSLEMHLTVCDICRAHLNEEKKLLNALDFALEEKTEIEIPENFAKVIAARAESSVSGLRNRRERSTALFLCASLFLFAVAGFGAETERVASAFFTVSDKLFAVVGFGANLIYDVSFGTVVILRTLGCKLFFNPAVLAAVAAAFVIVSIVAFPRLFARYNRS